MATLLSIVSASAPVSSLLVAGLQVLLAVDAPTAVASLHVLVLAELARVGPSLATPLVALLALVLALLTLLLTLLATLAVLTLLALLAVLTSSVLLAVLALLALLVTALLSVAAGPVLTVLV